MNVVATLSFLLCSTLVAACSRRPQSAAPLGANTHQSSTGAPRGASQLQSSNFQLSSGTLTCEPEGLIDLPSGLCVGTAAAQPIMTPEGCACGNEAYLAVPTDSGHACVHLVSVLETLQGIQHQVSKLGITDADSERPIFLDMPKEEALLQTFAVLGKDVRKADELIRQNASQKLIDRRIKYIIYTIEGHATIKPQTNCASTPRQMTRGQLFAAIPPIKP